MGKKLFFHTTEVEGGEVLQQGDEVDFVVATNKRTGKHSACCVRKIRYKSMVYERGESIQCALSSMSFKDTNSQWAPMEKAALEQPVITENSQTLV